MGDDIGTILYKKELEAAMQFLKKSIDVNNGHGSAHSYSYWLNPNSGWLQGYPETTGYLIPTLINAAFLLNEDHLLDYAKSCANWLVSIQNEEGSFYSGVDKSSGPSAFNTAMILFGLSAAIRHFSEEEYKVALEKSVSWLLGIQEKEGQIIKFAFHPNFQPAYYTRLLWALVDANEILMDNRVVDTCNRLRDTLMPYFHPNGVDVSGFEPDKPAFLHTIAYAYRGAIQYNCTQSGEKMFQVSGLERLIELFNIHGRWPGSINLDGSWNTQFRCLTGEAQMATLLLQSEKAEYKIIGKMTLDNVLSEQCNFGAAKGGLPGSKPFWGPYMTLRYPNWAAKFLSDAILAANGLKVTG